MRKGKLAKIIELASIGAVVLIVIIVALSTILPSYFSWKKVFDAVNVKAEKPPKTVLQSIEAELVEGKVYYDNNLASVKNEDLVVVAHYATGEEESSETLEPDVYDVSVPAGFAANGGEVTVKYKQKSATVTVVLEPVALESLEMTQNPYTIAYKTGDRFSYDGMEMYAVYNDGSKKLITSGDYVTDIMTPLANGTATQKVTYTDGDKTAEYEVPIKVADNFNNGRIVSISAAVDCYADAGSDLADVIPLVKRTYESGNSEITTDYTVTNSSEKVIFGKEYLLSLTYKGDPRIKAEIPVTVRNHVEGEDTAVVGGKILTEASYTFEKGQFIPTGEEVSFAGSFSNAVKNGKESSITFSVESYTDCVADITLNCGNSYLTKDSDGKYWMQPLQINTILDITVNGEPVAIGNNVVLKGCGPSETTSYAPLYGVYYEFTFEDIALKAGGNVVKLEFKNSTEGATTCWNESPSTMNIDWINIDTAGTVVDENATVSSIEISENFEVEYGDDVEKVLGSIPVVATMSDGTRRKLDGNLYTVELTEGETDNGAFVNGTYTLTATLLADTKTTATLDFTIAYFDTVVTRADIVVDGGKVYWVFEFRNIGYEAGDYEFFDGTEIFKVAKADAVGNTMTLMIDVTEYGTGSYYPHARIKGTNYANGANSAGDIRGSELVFTDGYSVTEGGRTYTLVLQYSMPRLDIAEPEPAE